MRNEFEDMFGARELFVEPHAFRAWLAKAKLKASALSTPGTVQEAIAAFAQRSLVPTMVADVAVIDVCGPITYKNSWWSYYFGGASIQDLQQQFRAALADPAVKTIAFRIDSPGGVVDMMPEFADEVFSARGQKPLLAVADTLVASCAYWLASQVDTIYASTSAQLGAIGVYCAHADYSGMLEQVGIKITLIAHGDHKVEGNPYEPLSDDARAELQANVDEIGDWFDAAVARGRGVKKSVVLESFGQGRIFRGKEAISLGLADKAGTFGQVIGRLTKGRSAVVALAAAPATPAPAARKADDDDDGGCDRCIDECPCEEEECPPECSTCSKECACYKAKTKAAAVSTADQVAADEAAIIAATE